MFIACQLSSLSNDKGTSQSVSSAAIASRTRRAENGAVTRDTHRIRLARATTPCTTRMSAAAAEFCLRGSFATPAISSWTRAFATGKPRR